MSKRKRRRRRSPRRPPAPPTLSDEQYEHFDAAFDLAKVLRTRIRTSGHVVGVQLLACMLVTGDLLGQCVQRYPDRDVGSVLRVMRYMAHAGFDLDEWPVAEDDGGDDDEDTSA